MSSSQHVTARCVHLQHFHVPIKTWFATEKKREKEKTELLFNRILAFNILLHFFDINTKSKMTTTIVLTLAVGGRRSLWRLLLTENCCRVLPLPSFSWLSRKISLWGGGWCGQGVLVTWTCRRHLTACFPHG